MHMMPIAKTKALSCLNGTTCCIQTPKPDINDAWLGPLQKADPGISLGNSDNFGTLTQFSGFLGPPEQCTWHPLPKLSACPFLLVLLVVSRHQNLTLMMFDGLPCKKRTMKLASETDNFGTLTQFSGFLGHPEQCTWHPLTKLRASDALLVLLIVFRHQNLTLMMLDGLSCKK